MNYHFEDFTRQNYAKLIDIAKDRYRFVGYHEIDASINFVLWRHDIDVSPHRALELAKIEHQKTVKATYFVWLHSPMYHFFEKDVVDILNAIKRLGHSIGLHFDAGFYGYLNESDLDRKIRFEREILEAAVESEIAVFSYHDPGFAFPDYSDYPMNELAELFPHYFKSSIGGLTNTYGRRFREDIVYCSDSNGYWRHQRLQDVLESPDYRHRSLQVLTHPEWWVHAPMPPRSRIQGCIDGRARNSAQRYDRVLKTMDRKNIS